MQSRDSCRQRSKGQCFLMQATGHRIYWFISVYILTMSVWHTRMEIVYLLLKWISREQVVEFLWNCRDILVVHCRFHCRYDRWICWIYFHVTHAICTGLFAPLHSFMSAAQCRIAYQFEPINGVPMPCRHALAGTHRSADQFWLNLKTYEQF